MPGYVYLAAGVYAFGGGLLAIKMIGVASGALATAAAYGTARAIFGRGAAFVAGLLCALWPAGIAVSSVTGTDMPAAALLGLAVWLLARNAARRPLGAPVAFGLVMGLASYVRAVALPLVLLAAFHFRARGASWVHVLTRTIAAAVVAFLVLLPWGLRNHHVYGELFFTDSHGGHTALVGANPNSDGSYSRSLNRLFSAGTGYALFAPPHRESDRVAYALAKQWTAFSPPYALGPAGRQGRSPAGGRASAALLAALPAVRAAVRDLVRRPPGRHRAGGRRQLLPDDRRHRHRDRGRGCPSQLAGADAPAAAGGAAGPLHAVLCRGPLPSGDRRAPAAVRRQRAGLGGDRHARSVSPPRRPPPGGDRGAGRRGHPGAALRRVAPGRQRRDLPARKEPLGGLRLPGGAAPGASATCARPSLRPGRPPRRSGVSGTGSACGSPGRAQRRPSTSTFRPAFTAFPCAPRRSARRSTPPSI